MSLVEINPVVLKNVKSLQTDGRRTPGYKKSSFELSAKVRFVMYNVYHK